MAVLQQYASEALMPQSNEYVILQGNPKAQQISNKLIPGKIGH